jgi:hypothetical protein
MKSQHCSIGPVTSLPPQSEEVPLEGEEVVRFWGGRSARPEYTAGVSIKSMGCCEHEVAPVLAQVHDMLEWGGMLLMMFIRSVVCPSVGIALAPQAWLDDGLESNTEVAPQRSSLIHSDVT